MRAKIYPPSASLTSAHKRGLLVGFWVKCNYQSSMDFLFEISTNISPLPIIKLASVKTRDQTAGAVQILPFQTIIAVINVNRLSILRYLSFNFISRYTLLSNFVLFIGMND